MKSTNLYQYIVLWAIFPEKKEKTQKLFPRKKQRRFFIEKTVEKSERSLPIAKVSGKPVETADKNIHSFQLIRICKKWNIEMMTVDFINICSQKNSEEEAVINTIEIKIKNDKTQNMFKTQKNSSQVQPQRSALFQYNKKQHKKNICNGWWVSGCKLFTHKR